MYKLAPSILAADFSNLAVQIYELNKENVDYIHLDVMDGIFVPNISFGTPVIQSLRKCTEKIFDVHLMVKEPIRFLEDYQKAGADSITVHVEACKHLYRTITMIREIGCKVGVALNPATPLSTLDYILEKIDMVLIMSVSPGYGGQNLIPSTFAKIEELRREREKRELDFEIEVDGGVRADNVKILIEAGVEVFVAGTAIFEGNIKDNLEMFRKKFQEVSINNNN